MGLGGLPATDEGAYAYHAQLIYHNISTGLTLPDSLPLALHPMLLSWVFGVDANPFMLLRVMDLLAATAMAFLLFRVLLHVRASSFAAALLVMLFMFAMNQPLFIQSGFKNSIAVAFTPLLLALLLSQRARAEQSLRWGCIGGLTALAILLCEPFLPFAVLGLVAVGWKQGKRPALAFAAGGLITGIALIGAIVFARGGWHGLLGAYQRAGEIYGAVSEQRSELFVLNGTAAIRQATAGLLFVGLLALTMVVVVSRAHTPDPAAHLAFWVAAAALPLIEPVTKIGFPYHFAACLPGLAGLSAVAWRHAGALAPRVRIGLGLAGLLAIASMADKAQVLWRSWRAMLATPGGQWPAEAVQQSNYLLAADAIKRAMPTTGGSLSISGFMFALYPLTGYLLPRPDLAHLTEAIIRAQYSTEALSRTLMHCPPQVIMTTTRTDWPGRTELTAAVERPGMYALTEEIPVSTTRAYGNFRGDVYRLAQLHSCATP